jgi:hypothetical protein
MNLFSTLALTILVAADTAVGATHLRALGHDVTAEIESPAADEVIMKNAKTNGIATLITIEGLNHDNANEAKKYAGVLGGAFKASFDALVPKQGIHVESIVISQEIDVPGGSSLEMADVGETSSREWSGFWAKVVSSSDDKLSDFGGNLPPVIAFLKANPGFHGKMEASLCKMLRDSSLDTFAKVESCSISFLHKPSDADPSDWNGIPPVKMEEE